MKRKKVVISLSRLANAKRGLTRKGWSQRAAAKYLGLSYQHVCLVLNGRRPAHGLLERLVALPPAGEGAGCMEEGCRADDPRGPQQADAFMKEDPVLRALVADEIMRVEGICFLTNAEIFARYSCRCLGAGRTPLKTSRAGRQLRALMADMHGVEPVITGRVCGFRGMMLRKEGACK